MAFCAAGFSTRVPVPVKWLCWITGSSLLAERGPLRRVAIPREPAVLLLVEDEQRLVAQLRELRAPARAAAHGEIGLDRADHVDLLAVVDLIPDALQDLAERRRVRIPPVHQPRDVGEADFAGSELFVIEHAQAARARRLVALEREIDFLDAEALGARAELRFRALRAAAEEDYVFAFSIDAGYSLSSSVSVSSTGVGAPASAASASARRPPDRRAS